MLTQQVNCDPLTGHYNRRYLTVTMGRELARCMREGQPLNVLMIDIDHFKVVNDTYGHQAGDEVLKQLGAILVQEVRGSDLACRYGGEEFLVLFPNMPLSAAGVRAEQYRQKVEAAILDFWGDSNQHAFVDRRGWFSRACHNARRIDSGGGPCFVRSQAAGLQSGGGSGCLA